MRVNKLVNITAERGCLRHDDRLDALSIAVAYFTEAMARDEEMGIEQHRQDALDIDLASFMENAIDPQGNSASTGSASWMSRYTA